MGFIFRESIRSIRRSPGIFVMSVLALGVSVGLGAFLASAALEAHARLADARSNLKIEAFFDPAIASTDAEQIASSRVRPLAGVSRIEVTSKEQAVADFARSTGENVQDVLGVNPLPASVRVYLHEPTAANAQTMKASLEKIDGVVNVRTDLALVSALESRTRLLETLAAIFGGLCIIATILFLILAGRFSVALRSQTVSVMRSLGATRAQISLPVTLEALAVGLLGGILGSAVLLTLQRILLDRLGITIVEITTARMLSLSACCMAAAIVVSLSASGIARAVRKN